jgi:protein phosphatase
VISPLSIYGPEYTRSKDLGTKRSLALREFRDRHRSIAAVIEREPLRCVHEYVFGVLALESEPVDPRL